MALVVLTLLAFAALLCVTRAIETDTYRPYKPDIEVARLRTGMQERYEKRQKRRGGTESKL